MSERLYIQTFTGRKFYWDDLAGNDIAIEDIAHALANNCRFTGHCREFYSVAQHSCYVSQQAPQGLRMEGLLHDAAEAYVHDAPTPLKRWLRAQGSDVAFNLEHAVQDEINETFGLTRRQEGGWESIKDIDQRMYATEARDLMPHRDVDEWEGPLRSQPYSWHVDPLLPAEAEDRFLDLFYRLERNLYER